MCRSFVAINFGEVIAVPNPAAAIRRRIDDATATHTITGTRTIGQAPKTIAERLPYECAGCGARYAGETARDGCCIANAFVGVFDDA